MHLCVPHNTASSGLVGKAPWAGISHCGFNGENTDHLPPYFACLELYRYSLVRIHQLVTHFWTTLKLFPLWFQVFCAACCSLKCKLLYMDRKEARVCVICHSVLMNGKWKKNLRCSTSLALCWVAVILFKKKINQNTLFVWVSILKQQRTSRDQCGIPMEHGDSQTKYD